MRFIGFEREISAEKWARPLLGLKDEPEFFRAMSAVDDDDKFVCTAIFNNFTPRNIDISFAARGGNWASPKETLRMFNAIFTYIFKIHEASRATALIGHNNQKSIRFVKRLGFKHEGTMRQAYDDNEDLEVFGFLRNEYDTHRWCNVRTAR